MSKNLKATLAAIICNVIFGLSFMFAKVALEYAHPLIILSVRFTIAFAVMNLMWLFRIVKLNLKGKPKKYILLMALAQPFLYFIFELYGIELTSSALSGVIISLVPVFVLIMSSVFLKEKPTLGQVIFSLISLAAVIGISLGSNDGNKNHLIGILLLLGAVIAGSTFDILSRKESGVYSPFERTYIMFLCGMVGFNITALCGLGKDYFPMLKEAVVHPEFWGSMGYLAIISSIAAFMLLNYSIGIIGTVKNASFANLITVVSVLAGILILKERLSLIQLLLCVVIIVGVIGVNKYNNEKG
ncbi:MAG: DMT family transporter [Clostridia bacterium]|nr:DMT family transporter [Clostridia bacterium]